MLPRDDVVPVNAAAFAHIRRRVIFDCCKWDPQMQDVGVLSSLPMILRPDTWKELSTAATALFSEALSCEEELIGRPALHRALGLSRRGRKALRACSGPVPRASGPRVMRFDFHPTRAGWMLSEVNADVPGGYAEASGFASLVAEQYPGARAAGDPAGALAESIRRRIGNAGPVALVHATAYADDAQVMRFLERRLGACGVRAVAASPTHLRWSEGRARIEGSWHRGGIAAIVRFFPAEWLENIPRAQSIPYFAGGAIPHTNPASAMLVQSKRFPLVWDRLETAVPAWRRFLPETVDPRDAKGDGDGWVLKPAFGRVGEGVGVLGVTGDVALRKIRWRARTFPSAWVAQRRFEAIPWRTRSGTYYPCVGVFVVDGRVAGAYGRMAARPLIDERALDVAVLVEGGASDLAASGAERTAGVA